MSGSIAESYEHCRRVARAKAKNFYYSFLLLPAEQRASMCAVYAFMRECDDLSDEPGASAESGALERWREEMVRVLGGEAGQHVLWPAFRDTVERYRIPHAYFHDMIDGVSSDLVERRVETFAELYRYCYQVASVVGLTIIHIFGFEDRAALDLAEKCGIAFQLTNIIRDVKEDEGRGRVYLPAEDLRRFGVERIAEGEALRRLLAFEAERARGYYEESAPLLEMVGKRSRASLWALIEIYSRLLSRIEASGFAVLRERIRLSSAEKVLILVRALLWERG